MPYYLTTSTLPTSTDVMVLSRIADDLVYGVLLGMCLVLFFIVKGRRKKPI